MKDGQPLRPHVSLAETIAAVGPDRPERPVLASFVRTVEGICPTLCPRGSSRTPHHQPSKWPTVCTMISPLGQEKSGERDCLTRNSPELFPYITNQTDIQ